MSFINITILITIIFIALILLYCFKSIKFYEGFNVKYKKCSSIPVKGIMKDIFDKNNISLDNEWQLYIPCGYNSVEKELLSINPKSNDQIIFGISGCDKIVSKNNIYYQFFFLCITFLKMKLFFCKSPLKPHFHFSMHTFFYFHVHFFI